MRNAQFKGVFQGRRWHLFQVRIRTNDTTTFGSVERTVDVLAPSAADACNWVQENEAGAAEPNTEVETRGPRGGVVQRFTGWHSFIARGLGLRGGK